MTAYERPEVGSGAPAAGLLRSCLGCRHHRRRSKAVLFGAAELQTAGGLRAQLEWQQQERQHAEREAQMVAAGVTFSYEPHHYDWCAAYSTVDVVNQANEGDGEAVEQLVREGGAVLDPVTGRFGALHVLCVQGNPSGSCERHEP